jgi:hypothetical protein
MQARQITFACITLYVISVDSLIYLNAGVNLFLFLVFIFKPSTSINQQRDLLLTMRRQDVCMYGPLNSPVDFENDIELSRHISTTGRH